MFPAVETLLTELLRQQQAVAGLELLGVYLRGSLATGDFDPVTSDVDLLCVIQEPLTAGQFAELQERHARVAALDHPYARDIELAYLPRAASRQWRPGEQHATLARGEHLVFKEHGANWLLERQVVLQRGLTVHGPAASAFIDPVSTPQVRWAVQARLLDWAEFARTPGDPAWQAPLGHTAYCVETMCRALCTLATGELTGKPAALAWAAAALPEPWRTLVGRVPAWKTDPAFSEAANREAQAFILWAAARAQRSDAEAGPP